MPTEDYCTGVLKSPRGSYRVEEELFRHRVLGKTVIGAVCECPERGYDDDFGAFGYEFSKGFWEGEIPADEEAHGTERRLEHFVWSVG